MRDVIICISPTPVDGYPPTQYQAELLADAGLEVVLLTTYLAGCRDAEFTYPKVRCLRFALAEPGFLRRYWAFLRFALVLIYFRLRFHRRLAAEIAYDPRGIFLASILPFRSKKLIGHLHETLTSANRPFDFFERHFLRHPHDATLLLVPDAQRAVLLQKQAGRVLNIRTVRNVPLLKAAARKAFHTTAGDKYSFSVVYHGSLGPAQSIDAVIQSMPLWPPKVRFHIYGRPGVERQMELEVLARQLGVDERLCFEGWVPTKNLIERLREHSVGLSFLKPETDNWKYSAGASNKRYQYMQAGLAQISDNNPDVIQLIEGNKVGFCVAPDNPRAIAEKVNLLFQDKSLRAKFGSNGHRLYETEFYYEKEFAPVLSFILEKNQMTAHL
jgi:glycosyltransferase involved in cell wall biosynthesis